MSVVCEGKVIIPVTALVTAVSEVHFVCLERKLLLIPHTSHKKLNQIT